LRKDSVVTITNVAIGMQNERVYNLLFEVKNEFNQSQWFYFYYCCNWYIQVRPDVIVGLFDKPDGQLKEGIVLTNLANEPVTVTNDQFIDDKLWLEVAVDGEVMGWIEADQTDLLEPAPPAATQPE